MGNTRKIILRFDETFIIVLLLIQVFIIQWLNLALYYFIIVDVILISYIIKHLVRIRNTGISFIPIFLFFLYCMFQMIRSESHFKTLVLNIYPILSSLLIIITLSYLTTNRDKLQRFFARMFPVINGYMLINIPVFFLQMNNHFELSGRHAATTTNSFKPDLISGLFGYNGTPILATFSAFFFIYDLWYYRYYVREKNKKKYLVYYVLLFSFYLFISIPNQNSGYFLVLGMFMIVYYLNIHKNYLKIIQKIRSSIRGALAVTLTVTAIAIGYNTNKTVSNLVNKLIKNINIGTTSINVSGSAERFAMITYYFQSNVNKLFGVGIGKMKWREKFGFGFLHFGQSDMGPFLLIGGFIFVVLLLVIFANSVYAANKSRFITLCECLLLIVLLVFTQLYTTISILISFILFVSICTLEEHHERKISYG